MQSLIINPDDSSFCINIKNSVNRILDDIKKTNFNGFTNALGYSWFLVDDTLLVFKDSYRAATLCLNTLNLTIHSNVNRWKHQRCLDIISVLISSYDLSLTIEKHNCVRIRNEFYVVDNMKDMIIDKDGKVIQVSGRWKHQVINLPVVNSWIKSNLPFISDMRKVAKMLGTESKYKDCEVIKSDIQKALGTSENDKAIAEERIAYGKAIKPAVAEYMQSIGLDPYIITYFDTYSELQQHRARKTKE